MKTYWHIISKLQIMQAELNPKDKSDWEAIEAIEKCIKELENIE